MNSPKNDNQQKDISAITSDGSEGRYRMSYRDVAMHKVMLQDIVRTEAYQHALHKIVTDEHTVMDFGCGTAVLSMFAAKAGAKQVIAVDRSPFIKTAKEIAQTNSLNNIDFYHDDHESLELEEKVDVIVSEWMGHCLFYEAMLEPLITLRDKYLKPGGRMIPEQVRLHIGLVTDEQVLEDLAFLGSHPYGLDFAPIAKVPFQQSDLVMLEPDCLLDSVADFDAIDMLSIAKAQSPRVFETTLIPSEKAQVYALCAWFSTELSAGVGFGTGPFDTPTHWDQILLPLPEAINVDPSRELRITLSPLTEQVGKEQFWRWSISDGIKFIEVDEQKLQEQATLDVPQGRL